MFKHKNIIATFHEVHDQNWFEDIIVFFLKNYKVVNTSDLYLLMKKKNPIRNVAHLTIDDGHNSFYNTIYPVLKKYNIPATLFVSPKICIEQKNFWFQLDKNLNHDEMIRIISEEIKIPVLKISRIPYHSILKCLTISKINTIIDRYYIETHKAPIPPQNMSVDQLVEVDRSGLISIGAHTLDHPILSNESDESAENQIVSSISSLQKILGHQVNYFAYPNGMPKIDFGQREIEILRANNIKLAFSGRFNTFNVNSDFYGMPRMGFSQGTTATLRMKIILGQLWPYMKALRNRPEQKFRTQFNKLSHLH